MAQGKPQDFDLNAVHQLQAQGVPLREIARRLQIPRSTLQDQLKRALPAKATNVDTSGATEVHSGGATNVHIDLPLADLADFHDMLAQTASQHCLRQRGTKPTVLDQRNPSALRTLALSL